MRVGRRLPRRGPSLSGVLVLTALLLTPPFATPAPPPDPLSTLLVQSFPEPIPAPALSLNGADGRPLRLEDFRGRVVLLNFWATWCVPCRQEMPAMERLYRKYSEQGLAVVAVNFRESEAKIQAFVNELPLTVPVGMDPEGAAAQAFGVRGLPVTYLLARDGRILWKALGSRDWDSLAGQAYFEKILQAPIP